MLKLRKLISLFLLALCLQWIIPHELVHSFCDHTDTIDQIDQIGYLAVGQHHEHCLILELSVPPMLQDVTFVEFLKVTNSYFYKKYVALPIAFAFHEIFECRGPPNLLS